MDNKIESVLLRGSPASEAKRTNYVLLAKEIGIETDTYKMKLGDGRTKWNSLPYLEYSNITKQLIDLWNLASKEFNIFKTSAAYTITQADIDNWNNPPTPVLVETDPIFIASPAAGISLVDINNWNSLVGGGVSEDDVIAYAAAL